MVSKACSALLVSDLGKNWFPHALCALGVTLNSGGVEVAVHAPVVISNAGIFNTFQKLLPPEIQGQSGYFLFLYDRICLWFSEW